MRLDEFEIGADSDIIIGGDFNVILDCDRDGSDLEVNRNLK